MTNKIIEKLQQASDSLLMPSESEYPFEVFRWVGQAQETLSEQKLIELTGLPQDTPVETVDLDYFFRNCAVQKEWHDETQAENVAKFQSLLRTLKENLTNIKVYRLGKIEIHVYIVGKTTTGDLAGISTKVVET